jgi:mRNA-degrading endonuclease RelE of RelBE toxin-antitoxin system
MNQQDVKRLFRYDDSSGELVWRVRADRSEYWNRRYSGSVAGSVYVCVERIFCQKSICINNKNYKANRLVWIYHNGDIPGGMQVGHKDNDAINTRIENLYLTDHLECQQKRNTNTKRKERHGLKGVYRKKGGGYRAMITIEKKQKYLGFFKNPADAAMAYNKAALEYMGENASVNSYTAIETARKEFASSVQMHSDVF